MKKYIIVALLIVFLTVGCGKKNSNQVKCTAKMPVNASLTIDAEIIAYFDKDDKLNDATFVYDLKDKDMAEQYCSMFKLMESAADGVKVKCSGTKITIEGYGNLETADDAEEIMGMTKSEFIKTMESYTEAEFSCK